MNENDLICGFSTHESPEDYRTLVHASSGAEAMVSMAAISGGYSYAPEEIEHQHKEGICTGISFEQNSQKVTGRKYSPDFQYLLQKKFIDGNWDEGSSIMSALKVGKAYGFLPIQYFTQVTENDRFLPYGEYIAKLKAIPDAEIQRLIGLCVNKLTGYAMVDVSDANAIALAIEDSKAGILCRYEVGAEWWTKPDGTPSWDPAFINPLRPPKTAVGGHAIIMSQFDYTNGFNQVLANTWGTEWCKKGTADIDYSVYKPTEAWIPYYDFTPDLVDLPPAGTFKHQFFPGIKFAPLYNKETEYLQTALMIQGLLPRVKKEDFGFYGVKTAAAVLAFQKKYKVDSWWNLLMLRGRTVGPKTVAQLNKLFNS